MPRWLLGAKVLLAVLLAVGAAALEVGGFEGKGMVYRLPLFLVPALAVPPFGRRRAPYPLGLDVALTLPFLFDTAANAVGLYDRFARTDDVLHAVNWIVLAGGIAQWMVTQPAMALTPRRLTAVAASGVGALAAIGWEAAEYAVMRSGVGGLSLTYGDTIADLLLSSGGGILGAVAVIAVVPARR